jgi:flagellar export protein FliJ
MKHVRFSLQSILVLRQHKERNAQQRFAEAMSACDEAALQLQTASDELAAGWTSLCEELSAGVSATRLVRTRSWCSVLESRQKKQSLSLQNARRAMNDVWREMMLATREREALDYYQDKCRREYDRGAQREEQKRLDELGIRRAVAPGLLSPSCRLVKDRL